MQRTKQVVLLSVHYFESKRQVGFHWIADAFWRAGWEVIFVTGYLSWLSFLRPGNRFLPYPVRSEANHLKWVRPGLGSYVRFMPYHPVSLGNQLLNQLTTPLFSRFGELPLGELEQWIIGADLFIFENGPDLMLFDRFKQLNPAARYVYRVSDYLGSRDVHPVIKEAEKRVVSRFDLVSAPCDFIYQKFRDLPNAAIHPHGIARNLFDNPFPNPYKIDNVNAVFVGNSKVDLDFAERATRIFPEWLFHFIGPIRGLPSRHNSIIYGELPFAQTVPYLQHADIGLQMLNYLPGIESVTDSLKMMQYTYCALPIVAPEFLRSNKPHVFYYHPGDDLTIHEALLAASKFDRSLVPRFSVQTWDSVACTLAGEALVSFDDASTVDQDQKGKPGV